MGNGDLFLLVIAIDIDDDALNKVKAPWNEFLLWGPKVIGVRGPKDNAENMKSVELSLQGFEPSARPDWWQPLETSRLDVVKHAKPVGELRKRHSDNRETMARIEAAIKGSSKSEDDIQWLPMTSRRTEEWIVRIDAQTTLPLAYAAVDGF